ncbi:Hypothetical predicted protein [Olea europaea subsp. europaea]|uniref:Uncharacterized protein n=1 Tax=Olea europaea subsp. europaea TaxID=158383 RepID=A0A8S0TG72_OLEEU|nr:Hypothetical predicted protein [Olea europaea subsp. europaea]
MKVVCANEPRGRRTGLVVPPLAMAIDDNTADDGGSSSTDGSVVSKSFPDNGEVAAAAAAAAARLKSEEERRRKGKMLAVDQTLPCAKNDAPRQPPVEKLMGDAIRSLQGPRSLPDMLTTAVKDIVFDDIAIVSDALRDVLRGLGAGSPVRVCHKNMSPADRANGQNRLLMSCKDNKKKKRNKKRNDDHPKVIPFANWTFSAKELSLVRQLEQRQKDEETIKCEKKKRKREEEKKNRRKRGEEEKKKKDNEGLDVQAYDRNGKTYHLTFKFLTCNIAYRIIGSGYKHFLKENNLLIKKPGENKRRKGKKSSSPKAGGSEDRSSSPSPERNGAGRAKQEIDNVRIELWAFRSRKLELGCTDHEEGALGMVLLHYREDDGAEHVMEPEGPDHQVEAMPDFGVGAHEMVMAEPNDVPEMALPVAAGPRGEAAALRDMDGSTTPQREQEAAEGLVLLGGHTVERLEVASGGGCIISAFS